MTCADFVAMLSLMGDNHGFKMSGHGDISPKEHAGMQEYTDGIEDFPYIPEFFFEPAKVVESDKVDASEPPYMTQEPKVANISKQLVQTNADKEMAEPSMVFESTFHNQYWRNDRKNIQCFPYCPEFGDYLSMRLKNKEHTRPPCSVPVIVRSRVEIKLKKGVHCVSRICFASDSLELKPGQKFSANEYGRIKEHLWQGKVVPAKDQGEYNEIHFRATKWKVYKTQCKTRKPLNMQRSTKYAFEAFILKKRDDGDYNVLGYAMSSSFELASTRELSKQLHVLKVSSSSSSAATTSVSAPNTETRTATKRSPPIDNIDEEVVFAKKMKRT